ncbi:MAG: EAL domain-containing protein [Betaproteobacteria bacterium HGW-Betaproteobacteria-12]|nr:MAG: EAL domain-containing protein [Betaproteobacteria bacterium HGW-Betaproteobacteria-12]
MPLTDLVRTLNAPNGILPAPYARSGLDQPFVASDGRVFLHYANIRIESQFLPVVETATGKLHGHAASFQAFGLSNRVPLLPEAVFVLPSDDREFIYLDRLVRTLHALNYLTAPRRGNLLLKVHARHVLSVPADHGLAFEEILRPCGLFPEQVTLEIDSDGIEDSQHLIRAVSSYRARGYGIAIGNFGRSTLDFGLLRELQPDIVKLDSQLLAASRTLKRIIAQLHQLPARVMLEDKETATLRKASVASEIDLLLAHAPLKHLYHAGDTPSARAPWEQVRSAA